MSLYRELENIYKAGYTHMVGDGFRVINFIPGDSDLAKRLNPFVLLDYNPSFYFPPTDSPLGVGYIHIVVLKRLLLPIKVR